uniref:Uncharacterized protein n=1 Tax=Romanomermis culicivorax TaxID=13658 RepID=A0A915L4Q7_ROMCU
PFPRADIDYGHGDLGLEPGFVHRDRRLFPPGFLRQIRNRHVFSGFPAVFDCIVTGNPVPEAVQALRNDCIFFRLKNGQPLKPDGRIKTQICGGNSYALIFLRTVPEDQGEYSCLATNTQGSISSSAVLEVTVPMLDKMSFDGRYSPWLADEADFRKVPYSSIPVPPDRGPFIAEVTGHYLTLSWIPTLRPPPHYPQITYIVEIRELPDKGWTVVDFNISQPCCKVRNLELGKSYQFRVRAENIYGISDPSPPSPPSQLMAPPKPVLDKWRRPIPNFDPYAVEALNRCYAEQYACAPWFAPRQMEKMYCAENQTLEIVFWVYGYPDPDVKWYFRGWEITSETHGRRFESKCYGGTECVLIIRHFTAQDVGQYQCKAVNQHGDAQQNVLVDISTMPTFIHHLDNKVVPSNKTARLDCRVDATPFPEIKWFKDWHPIVESSRVKMIYEPPYLCSLMIENPVLRDSGIYTCAAINEAGRATSTATLTIEIDPYDYGYDVDYVRPPKKVALAPRKVREIYTIEEEILKAAEESETCL